MIPDPTLATKLPTTCVDLFAAKQAKGLTFDQIGEILNKKEVYVAQLFFGQSKPTADDIAGLSKALEIPTAALEKSLGDGYWPTRGEHQEMPPRDPTVYRLYEWLTSYGPSLRSCIFERMGQQGIMSLIASDTTLGTEKVDGADWITITIRGKWLPYVGKWDR